MLGGSELGGQLKNLNDQLKILIMSRLNLTQLETFFWIARLGSFRQAAGRLNISQPTVSLRIRQLEGAIGVPLFERAGHHVTLSEPGEKMLSFVDEMMSLSKRIETHFPALGGFRGVVRLGLPESIAAACLSELIDRVEALAPQLRLDVTVDLSSAINRKLKNLSLDVAILAEPDLGAPITVVPIGKNPLAWLSCVATAPKGTVNPKQLAHFRVLTTPENSPNHAVVMEWFASAGAQPSRISMCNNLVMIMRLISDGVGIGVLPLAMVQTELADGSLVRLDCQPALRNRTLQAAYHTEGTGATARAIEAVVQVARETLSQKMALLPMTVDR
jgi:DNA-binding transcriptional LysR family regulator